MPKIHHKWQNYPYSLKNLRLISPRWSPLADLSTPLVCPPGPGGQQAPSCTYAYNQTILTGSRRSRSFMLKPFFSGGRIARSHRTEPGIFWRKVTYSRASKPDIFRWKITEAPEAEWTAGLSPVRVPAGTRGTGTSFFKTGTRGTGAGLISADFTYRIQQNN